MINPAYRISTPRMLIRCYNPNDAFLLARAITESLDHLLPWMPWANLEPEPLTNKVERLRRMRSNFDLSNDFVYGIFNPEGTKLIGGTGLHPRIGAEALEIGYWIHKDYINKGYATEAAAALTQVAFRTHQVNRVEIHCAVINIPSATVPRKLGFIHEANLKDRGYASGKPCDQMIWSLFAQNYPNTPAAFSHIAAFDAAESQIIG
jgi:RimJ/RimL family protein N-acetyltransferase